MNKKMKAIGEESGLVGWDFDKLEYRINPDFECLTDYTERIIQECISQIALIGLSNSENQDIAWTADLAIKNIREKFEIGLTKF